MSKSSSLRGRASAHKYPGFHGLSKELEMVTNSELSAGSCLQLRRNRQTPGRGTVKRYPDLVQARAVTSIRIEEQSKAANLLFPLISS
jgi:hypothetical protein